jgi:NAD-dependent SIR2 family protein deacetylase
MELIRTAVRFRPPPQTKVSKMKKLECRYCHKDLGEIEKGKIRLGTVLVCKECFERILEPKKEKPNIDFFNDIFPRA